ncbi:MAG: glycosyltransferase family 39 protein [Candidatus Eisenbacteria bacterium]|nr:glycosyltransferase family 39 protein [Candidatus Eisenbacteria bacterium]
MRNREKIAAALAVFIVALATRLLFLSDFRASPYFDNLLIDPASYDRWAQKIAAGDFWGERVYYQAPLYAYMLGGLYALFGRDLLLVRILQSVLGSLTCVFLFLLTSQVFSLRRGIIAGLLAALYTPLLFMDLMILKSVAEIFFLAASLLALAIAAREKNLARIALAGLLFGIAVTGRGNLLFGVPFLAAWLLLREPRPLARASAARAGVFLLGIGLAILPVTIRNRVVGGDWVLVESDAGINVYVGNNPRATGIHTPPFDIRTVPEHEEEDAARFAERETGRPMKPSEVSSFWIGKALAFARAHPAEEAHLIGRKFRLVWNGYEVPDNYDQKYFARVSWIFRGFLPSFLWISPFALLGFALSARNWRRTGFLHLFVIAYLLSLLVLYVTARYRLPIVVGLLPLAAHGFLGFLEMLRARALRRAALAALLLVAVWLFGRAQPFAYRGFVKQETEIATFLADRGDLAGAERAFERAIEEGKGSGSLHLVYWNQGSFFARAGRLAEAEGAFRNALRENPAFTPARLELEKLQSRRNDAPGAGH